MLSDESNLTPRATYGIIGGAPFALALLLLVFLVLDGVAVFGPDRIRDVGPLVAGLGTFWQPVVIATWLVRGRTPRIVRWPLSIIGLALLVVVKLFATHGMNRQMELESDLILISLLVAQFSIAPLAVMFGWWRRRRADIPATRPWQFSLEQLLLWVTGISMLAAFARVLLSLPHELSDRLTPGQIGISCGVVLCHGILIAYIAACTNTPRVPRANSTEVAIRLLMIGLLLVAGGVLVANTFPMLLFAGPFCLVLQAVSAMVALSLAQDAGWKLFDN